MPNNTSLWGPGFAPSQTQQRQPQQQYGDDPKGHSYNAINQAQNRYNQQQGPLANQMAYNYGRGSEANYGDYTDIMGLYRGIASGGDGGDGGGSGGGGGSYSAFLVHPGTASYNDPFNSYAGYTDFSKTGGFSPEDIANMRARGVSPIRAAYANAEREVGRQRSLQGGYSPNAIASQVKMAREQGQSAADATQNVEAGLAQMRQQGRLAGLGGMSNIEGQRLGADVDLSKFNVGLDYQGQVFNAQQQAQAQASNNAAGAASAAQSTGDRLRALAGMTQLYGTNPGMSETFGNQAMGIVGQGGNFGNAMVGQGISAGRMPGQWEQTTGRIGDVGNMIGQYSNAIYPWLDRMGNRQPTSPQRPIGSFGGAGTGGVPVNIGRTGYQMPEQPRTSSTYYPQ